MIVKDEGEMVGLCDGIHRCLANPKMKKKKHVQMMRSEKTAQEFSSIMGSEDPDRLIRNAVKNAADAAEAEPVR